MRLAVLTKMFNESEFLEVFVRFYLAQGCDEIILLDHGSTDGSNRLVDRFSSCRLLALPNGCPAHYTYAVDLALCNYLLDYARTHTSLRTWWLFPDIDELVSAGPDSSLTLREFLEPLTDIDGVGCIGVHCLPVGQRDEELQRLTPKEMLARLEQLFPPRSFEKPPRPGEAWKNIVWHFHPDRVDRFRDLSFSVGSHVLIGQHQLRLHDLCLVAYHYKIRSLSRFCDRSRDILKRVPSTDSYVQMVGEKLALVQDWEKQHGRLLRLGSRLSSDAIRVEQKRSSGQGVYLRTPYPESTNRAFSRTPDQRES